MYIVLPNLTPVLKSISKNIFWLSTPKVHISEQQQPTCDDQDDVLVDGGVLDVEHVVGHHHDDGLESL